MDAETRKALEEIATRLREMQLDIDWQKDQQHMLTSGVQTAVSAQLAADKTLENHGNMLAAIEREQTWQRRIMLVPCLVATAALLLIVLRQLDAILAAPPVVLTMLGLR